MLGGQRHAPHRPLKQLVRTDNVGAGRRCRGWARELPGKVKGGERRWRGGEQTGVVVVVVEGGGGKQRGGVLKQRRTGRSHVTDRWTDR